MPVIKRTRSDSGSRISTRVPGVSAPSISAPVERATGELFGALADIGVSLLAEQKKIEDNNFANDMALSDRIEQKRHADKLSLEMPVDGRGYAAAQEKFARERYERNLSSATNSDAAQKYRERALPQLELEIARAQQFEQQTSIKYNTKRVGKRIDDYTSIQILTPDIDQALGDITSVSEEISASTGVAFTETVAQDLIAGGSKKVAQGYFEGLISTKNPVSLRLAQSVLAGKDDKSRRLIEHLDPDDVARFNRRINAELTSVVGAKASDDLFAARVVADELGNGNLAPGLEMDALRRVLSNPNISPERKEFVAADIRSSRLIGETLSTMRLQSPDKMVESIAAFNKQGSVFEKAQFRQKQAALQASVAQELKDRRFDAASNRLRAQPELAQLSELASSGRREDIQNYYSAQLSAQERVGIESPHHRLLTKDQAKKLARDISEMPADIAAHTILQRQAAAGEFFPKEVKELINSGNIKEDYFLVAYTVSPEAQGNIIRNIRNEKTIVEDFKKSHPTVHLKTFSQSVQANMQDISGALSQFPGDEVKSKFVNALRNQVSIEAMKLMNQGVNQSDALKRAKQTMITENFFVSEGGQSKVLVPRGNSEEMVSAFLEGNSTPEALQELGIRVPEDYKALLKQAGVSDDEEITRRFYKDMSERGRWVVNDDGTGVIFATVDGNRKTFRLNGEGKTLEFSYKEMTRAPNKRAQEAARGLFDKLSGLVVGR